MAITLPYSTANVQFGTDTYVYGWSTSVGSYSNSSVMTSSGYTRINSITRNPDGTRTVNVTVYYLMAISRSGSDSGVYTFQSTPNVRFYNSVLASYITIYNAALTTTCATGASASITHSSTVNISVPATWFATSTATWNFSTTQECKVVTSGAVYTHTKIDAAFIIETLRSIVVNVDGVLKTASAVWARTNDTLNPLIDMKIDVDGVLK